MASRPLLWVDLSAYHSQRVKFGIKGAIEMGEINSCENGEIFHLIYSCEQMCGWRSRSQDELDDWNNKSVISSRVAGAKVLKIGRV